MGGPDWKRLIEARLQIGPDIALQPIYNLLTADLVGYEALSRFPELPGVGPDEWFRQAAAFDLDRELEVSAIVAALTRLPSLEPKVYLSINASARTLLTEPFIMAVLGRFTDRIVVELTEHDAVDNYRALNEQLDRIRSKKVLTISVDGSEANETEEGVLFGIDDFGAGMANMKHLIELDPDIIKLDISLIRDIDKPERKRQCQLVAAITIFAAAAAISTTAEGVETEAERQRLRELGVNCGQGFLFGAPQLSRGSTYEIDTPSSTS